MTHFYNQRKYLQRLSLKQVEARIRKIQESPKPDYPEDIEFHNERIEIYIIRREAFKTPEIHHWELKDHKGKGRVDQYQMAYNGKNIFYNRKKEMVLNDTRYPVIMGLFRAFSLISSKLGRIGRH